MTDKESKAVGGCLAFIILLFLTPFSAMWRGYVLSVLWAWFIVSTFHVPAISIPVAIGVAAVAGMLTHQSSKSVYDDKEPTEIVVLGIIHAFIGPLITLFMGWIVKGFL